MNVARDRRQRVGIIAVPVFLAAVLALAWFGLWRLEGHARSSTGESLRALALTARAAAHAWFDSERYQVQRLAGDARLAPLLEELLETPRNAQLLLESPALAELQRIFGPRAEPAGRLGFLLLAPDGTVLAASLREEVGRPASRELSSELIRDVLSGRSVFVPPDVSVARANSPESALAVALAAPVGGGAGARAVLVQRYAATGAFSRALQLGRPGRSGEVYAFNRDGRLLSESRFTDQLVRLGLVSAGIGASLALRLSDPGDSPSAAASLAAESAQRPLTRMAASAIRGEANVDISGYRDYRGQRVLGAWLWDDELQLGLAAEIDEEEALEGYRANRTLVLVLLALVGSLALALLGWVVLEGDRTARELRSARDEWERLARERTLHLERSEAQFRSLFEGSRDAIVLISGTRLVSCNPAALSLFGQDGVESFCRLALDQLSPPSQPGGRASAELLAEQISSARTKSLEPIEWVFRRSDGRDVLAEVRLSPADFGDPPAIQAVIRDISARKQAEEALRNAKEEAEAATRAKTLFLANMSHEIRTPMNAILGYTQLLRREARLRPEQQEQLDVIQRSGDHLLGLIEDILDMSRVDAGRADLVTAAFDLESLLRGLEPWFRESALAKHVDLAFELDPKLIRDVEGDARKVTQVVLNLLSNAVRFTQAGRVCLRASSRLISRDLCRVSIAISDTGVGIASGDRERIFEAFNQPERTMRQGGTGLGLALSRSYARLMGGDVAVESAPGQGSTFTFQFELGVTAARAEAAAAPPVLLGRHAARFSASRSPDGPALSELMQGMSEELLEQLRDAARQARAQRIGELAERVAEQSHEAAARIRQLAEEYRYDSLLRALDVETPK